VAQPAREQRLLRWPRHPHRDVGVAPQQILGAVGQGEFEGDPRIRRLDAGQDGGQDFGADHFAGGDPHGARGVRRGGALGGTQQGGRGGLHRLGHRADRLRGGGGGEAHGGAGEQGLAQHRLERRDVPAEGGLRQPQCACGGGEAAMPQGR